MKVICKSDRGFSLPEEIFKDGTSFSKETNFYLNVGEKYTVYGMTIYMGYVWYYICDRLYSYYPSWKPCPLFEVIEGDLSIYWVFNFFMDSNPQYSQTIWAFPEWANDEYYYDQLTDGKEEQVKIFKGYKELMDLEFPDTDCPYKAEIIDDKWLLCPICIDAWQSSDLSGMVRCDKCSTMMNNPRYDSNVRCKRIIQK